jgi:exodeoxyribonuclease V gamma subunit
MTAKDVIKNWIRHLVLNSLIDNKSVKEGNTYYACKTGIYKYSPTAKSNRHLEDLLDLYWQGLSEPLFFFPNTSHAFALEIHKGKSEQEALLKATAEWEGNSLNKRGDRKDSYNLLCCKNITPTDPRFMETARIIFLPALEHQEKIKLSYLRT